VISSQYNIGKARQASTSKTLQIISRRSSGTLWQL